MRPFPHRGIPKIRCSLVLSDYHDPDHKGGSRFTANEAVGDVGLTLKLFADSVAEVFGLLLDVVKQRLSVGNEGVRRWVEKRGLDRMQSHGFADLLGKSGELQEGRSREGVMLGSLDYWLVGS